MKYTDGIFHINHYLKHYVEEGMKIVFWRYLVLALELIWGEV